MCICFNLKSTCVYQFHSVISACYDFIKNTVHQTQETASPKYNTVLQEFDTMHKVHSVQNHEYLRHPECTICPICPICTVYNMHCALCALQLRHVPLAKDTLRLSAPQKGCHLPYKNCHTQDTICHTKCVGPYIERNLPYKVYQCHRQDMAFT